LKKRTASFWRKDEGIDELRFICDNVTKLGLSSILDLDVTLTQGLNYTGQYLKWLPKEVAMGSMEVE
jgi:histidyl-tRNA synthetase